MITKEQLDEIKELTEKLDTLKNEIDDYVSNVAYVYSVATLVNKGNRPSSEYNFNEWYIIGDYIECHWSDSWSYGGYDEGVVTVPIVYFYDNEAFVLFVEQTKAAKDKQDKLSKKNELRDKKKLFEQLKKELGE